MITTINYKKILFSFILSLSFSALLFFYFNLEKTTTAEITMLNNNIQNLTNTIDNQEKEIFKLTGEYTKTISILETEKIILKDQYEEKKQLLEDFEDQTKKLFGAINTIQKIQKTDRELLAKYSKEYFLNEHYSPKDLVAIPTNYLYNEKMNLTFSDSSLSYLEEMLDDAEEEDLNLKIISAYRSFQYQKDLKQRNIDLYGKYNADRLVANQGLSEHQLGTTIDFIDVQTAKLGGFEKTEEYKWLQENAHKYGFVLSYTEDNKYYSFEPWHWRFVGTKLATHLNDEDKFFYEIEQREIYEYLEHLFD